MLENKLNSKPDMLRNECLPSRWLNFFVGSEFA